MKSGGVSYFYQGHFLKSRFDVVSNIHADAGAFLECSAKTSHLNRKALLQSSSLTAAPITGSRMSCPLTSVFLDLRRFRVC